MIKPNLQPVAFSGLVALKLVDQLQSRLTQFTTNSSPLAGFDAGQLTNNQTLQNNTDSDPLDSLETYMYMYQFFNWFSYSNTLITGGQCDVGM